MKHPLKQHHFKDCFYFLFSKRNEHPSTNNVEDAVPPLSTKFCFSFHYHVLRDAEFLDCKTSRRLSDAMELFLYVSKNPFGFETGVAFFFLYCISGKSILVCKYYSLFGRKSAPILINCIHEYLLFTARLNGEPTSLTEKERVKKNCKRKCTKK